METKKVPLISERVETLESRAEGLEKTVNYLAEVLNKEVMSLKQVQAATSEIINSIVKVSGEEFGPKLMAFIEEEQKLKKAANEKASKENIEKLLSEGKIISLTKVTSDAVMVGREFNKEKAVTNEYAVLAFMDIKKDFHSDFLDKSVGEAVSVPDGTFEILGIYQLVPEAPSPVAQA